MPVAELGIHHVVPLLSPNVVQLTLKHEPIQGIKMPIPMHHGSLCASLETCNVPLITQFVTFN